MASRELTNLVKELSQCIIKGRDSLQDNARNEEWTKIVLILPLLEALGWDRCTEIVYESSPPEVEDRLDFILKCKHPIGIEAKGLDVPSPRDITISISRKDWNSVRRERHHISSGQMAIVGISFPWLC